MWVEEPRYRVLMRPGVGESQMMFIPKLPEAAIGSGRKSLGMNPLALWPIVTLYAVLRRWSLRVNVFAVPPEVTRGHETMCSVCGARSLAVVRLCARKRM